MSDDTNDNSFDLKFIRWPDHDRLHHLVGRTKFNVGILLDVCLNRSFAIDQGDDGLPVFGRALFMHHHEVAG